ncbi:hypothetical protein ACIBSV_07460 [Embleya sp. NPDC050154]|uniref:hypothetical protein n=1 Tax=unclassified Embleya TaxID=2699296 RepID=UPI0037A0AA45
MEPDRPACRPQRVADQQVVDEFALSFEDAGEPLLDANTEPTHAFTGDRHYDVYA